MPKVKKKREDRIREELQEQERILYMLDHMASDMSEMKRVTLVPPRAHTDDPKFTTFDGVDAIREVHSYNQARILSTLTGLFSDMSKMKLLITGPHLRFPTPEDETKFYTEIMKRLPVESLVRFRLVSRTWKSWIDSSEFIKGHSNQPQHLLVQYQDTAGRENILSFADDDSFPHRSFVPPLPLSACRPRIFGCSYGLFSLSCYDRESLGTGKMMAVIWNPCIRKSIAIPVPHSSDEHCETFLGFGVCPATMDPKILHISYPYPRIRAANKSTCRSERKRFGKRWNVSVYTLSSGKFREPSGSINLPSVSMQLKSSSNQVVIDRLIYWCASQDSDRTGGALRSLIMSFDITVETFVVVHLPACLASLSPTYLSLSKLRESLVMLEYSQGWDSCGVWKLDNGLFTKLFTIKAPPSQQIWVLGFRKTGAPLLEVPGSECGYSTQLVAYEPNLNHCNDLVGGRGESHIVESYMETLLLINRSDCTSCRHS